MADKTDAWIDGWLAHKAGEINTDDNNPYNQHTQARSWAQWLSGWCARNDAVNHGLEIAGYDNGAWAD